MNIPERIKELCDKHGLSINEFARKSDIPQSTLATIMQGETSPRTETIERICNYFGLTLPEFFLPDAYVVKEDSEKYNAILNKIEKDKKNRLTLVEPTKISQNTKEVSVETIKKLLVITEELKKEIAED
jgi:transcriptional regulator with XRE-family HTH domain